MLFCIDIGNTNITLGVYSGDELRHHWRIATDNLKMPDEYAVLLLSLFAQHGVSVGAIEGMVLSSVVPPLTGIFQEVCEGLFGRLPLVVDAGIKTGVRVRTDNPREVGADLVVVAATAYGAARPRFGGHQVHRRPRERFPGRAIASTASARRLPPRPSCPKSADATPRPGPTVHSMQGGWLWLQAW